MQQSFTGATLSGGGVVSGQYINWSSPSLASGASVTFTFNAAASLAGKARLNAALIQSNPDSNSANNIAQAVIMAS